MTIVTLPLAARRQHALLAAALVAVSCGVDQRRSSSRRSMAFAVHGTAELAFTGAAAGLLIADNASAGALLGSLVVATFLGVLGVRERDRDAATGVVLARGPRARCAVAQLLPGLRRRPPRTSCSATSSA